MTNVAMNDVAATLMNAKHNRFKFIVTKFRCNTYI